MINIGVIGVGRIGKVHIESITNYIREAKIKAVADPVLSDEQIKFAKDRGIEECCKDYRKILEDKDIDAVLVCSSTNTHAPISIEAIKAGKHVFCEKPVDHDLENIKKVMQTLKTGNVKFQVGFNRRFDHNFAAVKQGIDDGKIGNLHVVKITSRDPEPPNPAYVKVSGGMLMDMTIHDFDMVRFLTGKEVEQIYVNSAVLVDKAIGEQGDIDTALITMKMSDGSLALIDNSRKAVYGYDQRAEVFGSGGMLSTSNDTESTACLSNAHGISTEKPLYFFLERYMQSFTKEIKEFVDAVINDKDTPVGILDGLNSVVLAKAGNISIRENRPVKISEIKF